MISRAPLLSLLITASHLLAPAAAVTFSCSGGDRCQSFIGYVPTNGTTIAAIQSLFQINPRRSLLAANALPLSTPPSFPLPSGSPIRIPLPCLCSNGTGLSNRRPVYTVRPNDGLDAIARGVFNGFVTYQEIAAANNVSDPNRIEVGQRLWIPLPCSCDEVDGRPVVHYGHVVTKGSNLDSIAEEFGTTEQVLMRVNGIQDPNSLEAGQILDVPLPACTSSISDKAMDSLLLLPNSSYTLTANNCIHCSCSSSTWNLQSVSFCRIEAVQQSGLISGLADGVYAERAYKKRKCSSASRCSVHIKTKDTKGVSLVNTLKNPCLSSHHAELCSSSAVCRKRILTVRNSQSCSDYDTGPYNANTQKARHLLGSVKDSILKLVRSPLNQPDSGDVKSDLIFLALPAVVGQALDPLAQLMETAYIGRLGPLELASAGISISIFNIISKIFNVPLLSVTTSFVAEDISKNSTSQHVMERPFQGENYEHGETSNEVVGRMKLPSVSTALLLAAVIGTIEALALFFGAGVFLSMMGISSNSPMRYPAQQFLSLRALGAPAVVVALAVQGVFRGFKDTKTPLLCIGLGNLSSVILLPVLVYTFHLGIIGAAVATIASQYVTTLSLMWCLSKRATILPPKFEDLQFDGYIKSGGFMLGRTLSILLTMTFGTSMAARLGPLAMAAHQICLQVWLAVSLLSDALAISAQALIASSFARYDYKRVKEVTYFVLKVGFFAGIALTIVLCASFSNIAELFTQDTEVLQIVKSGVLFVCATQPINSLAFIFDGLHYGVSDFSYAAYSSMTVGAISSVCLFYAPSFFGLPGVWLGLTLLMALRMAAGIMRLCWKTGPWWFLQQDTEISKVPS
ncbi:hypothetical protein J5N97_023812 [Dioscorea zingiberensis]|uniref:Protein DETOXIFICATION n=1 Tax=Dioscorea zingiberensis TaxID=325984 RepID=A0A9D5C5X7_9LILI|nr:hypothetical protein J5N97_023812 [Dioscorea zingiberensis]